MAVSFRWLATGLAVLLVGCSGASTETSSIATSSTLTTVPPSAAASSSLSGTSTSIASELDMLFVDRSSGLPSFHAVLGPPDVEDDWTVEIWHDPLGPKLRMEYVSGDHVDAMRFSSKFVLPDAGSVLITDGVEVGWFEHSEQHGKNSWEITSDRLMGWDPVQFLGWHREPGFSWMELCELTEVESLGASQIAGMPVVGVRCEGASDEWRLWVNPETGLVLKFEGDLVNRGQRWPLDFEIKKLEKRPDFDEDTFAVDQPEGSELDPRQYPSNSPPDYSEVATESDFANLVISFDPPRQVPELTTLVVESSTWTTEKSPPVVLLLSDFTPGWAHPDFWESSHHPETLNLLQRSHRIEALLAPGFGQPVELGALIIQQRDYGYGAMGLPKDVRKALEQAGVPQGEFAWIVLDRQGNVIHAVRWATPGVSLDLLKTLIDASG